MKGPFAISRLLLFVAMGGLIGLSFLAIRVLDRDLAAYRESNKEAIHWSAAQVEVELARFVLDLNRFVNGDEGVDRAKVSERFDILWSRTGLFRSGDIGERLRRHDQGLDTIPTIIAMLQQHEQTILALERGQSEANLALVADFAALRAPLRKLALKVLTGEQDRYAGVRRALLDSSRMTFWVWAATLLLAAVLIGVMFLEARRYTRQIRQTAKLAEEAQAANRAKARFLTMMSHELRTPMNGVMGLMALAKQSGMSESQSRLINQAERSGRQMVELLGNILDFSDLQSEALALDRTAFEPSGLIESITASLSNAVQREAVNVETEIHAETPELVVGDRPRIAQAVVHFCTYFVDTVGTRDLRVALTHDGTRLICEIDIEARDADAPGWQPEAIFGHGAGNHGDFSSDSVGPTIARGLIELMQGTVRIKRISDGRASLFVAVPAEPVAVVPDTLRIVSHSDTTMMLVHAALDDSEWQIWGPHLDDTRVGVLLIEAGGVDEDDQVARLRSQHPLARCVAIGEPANPANFEAIWSGKLDRLYLRALLAPEQAHAEIA